MATEKSSPARSTSVEVMIRYPDQWVSRAMHCPECGKHFRCVYHADSERIECLCGSWIQVPPLVIPPKFM